MPDAPTQVAPLPGSFPLSRRGVIIFSLSAAGLFTILAWAITVFYQRLPFLSMFAEGRPIGVQIMIGALAGAALAVLVGVVVLRIHRLAALRAFLREILARVRPTALDMFTVSLAAGVSEELFFRGTLQPMWGLWLAAFAFALIHVGGNVFTWTKGGFAAYVFVMGVLLGLLYEHVGLIAAISAHSVTNITFLFALRRCLLADLT